MENHLPDTTHLLFLVRKTVIMILALLFHVYELCAEFVVKTGHQSREESRRKSASEPRWIFKPKTKRESKLVTLSTIQSALPREVIVVLDKP